MKRIILSNWTVREDCAGGCETVYGYLKRVFPQAELLSGRRFAKGSKDIIEMIAKTDQYLLSEYKKDKNILIIRDAEFGGVLDISMIPQIVLFQNPYKTINEKLVNINHPWIVKGYINKVKKYPKIATTNFIANEMKSNNLKPDYIVPNCVDLNLFKPKNKKELRKKYHIPQNKRIGIWIGMSNIIKNFQMLLNLIEHQEDIFWILIAKDKFPTLASNTKTFHNQTHEQVSELLNCADFFMLTSPIEGCGLAAFEAMATNLPCILMRTGYFWDFWDDKIGISVDWRDFKAHVKAIQQINKIKTNSRKVLINQKLDYITWRNAWKSIVEEVKYG